MAGSVLDASALLAYLRDEDGADAVADEIAEGSTISTVNLGEVLSRFADRNEDPGHLIERLRNRGLIDGAITVEPFTTEDAGEVARLRPLTRDLGLSFGDRACLALASRLDLVAVTADSSWGKLDPGPKLLFIR